MTTLQMWFQEHNLDPTRNEYYRTGACCGGTAIGIASGLKIRKAAHQMAILQRRYGFANGFVAGWDGYEPGGWRPADYNEGITAGHEWARQAGLP